MHDHPNKHARVLAMVMKEGAAAVLLLIGGFWASFASAEINTDRWRWSNPIPHGNNILDLYVGEGVAMQVGDAGSIHVQEGGGRWVPALTGVTDYLRGATMLGSRLIAVGESGCILWSDDGKAFQKAELQPPTINWFEGVASSAESAISVGDSGAIYSSTDGLIWTAVQSGTTEWLRGVATGSGAFVAVGENGTILLSDAGGMTWNRVDSGTPEHLNRVRYLTVDSAIQFVAVGNAGATLASSTGSSGWTRLNSGTTNHLYDVSANDAGMLVVGDQEVRLRVHGGDWVDQINALPNNAPPSWVYLSAHGINDEFLLAGRSGMLVEGVRPDSISDFLWRPVADSSHAWLWDVTVQNGTRVAVGDLATIVTSLDGIVWASEVVPGDVTDVVLLGVGGDTNRLFAVGNDGHAFVSQSSLTNLTVTNSIGSEPVVTNITVNTLGVVWTEVSGISTQTLQGVAASADLYALSGANGVIYTSLDGETWHEQVTPTSQFLSGITAYPGGWIAVGAQGTLLHSGPAASSWSAIPVGSSEWLYRVRWTGDTLVAVGAAGSLFTSLNGTQWTRRTSGTSTWLNDVTHVDGTWFVVGNQGLILASTDLDSWQSIGIPTIKSLFGATAWDGQLVVAGIEGVILRNPVVPKTSPVNILDYRRIASSELEQSIHEIVLFGGQPDQIFEVQSCTSLSQQNWESIAELEICDPSGGVYFLRVRDASNSPPLELYRTSLLD